MEICQILYIYHSSYLYLYINIPGGKNPNSCAAVNGWINFSFGYYELVNRCKIVKKYKLNFYHFYYISLIKIFMSFVEVFINIRSTPKFLGNIVGLLGTIKISLKN